MASTKVISGLDERMGKKGIVNEGWKERAAFNPGKEGERWETSS